MSGLNLRKRSLLILGGWVLFFSAPLTPALADSQPNISYNTYFGYLHAHSKLSEGSGSPGQAYTWARDVGKLDFFALTDHGEHLRFWPWERKWDRLKAAAEATYEPGRYVTLWGFEWSSPVFGHVNVLNTSDYTDSASHYDIRDLYDWLSRRPGAFARFNHPGDYDDAYIEFFHLWRYSRAVPQMVGIETWNGNRSFDRFYYDGGWVNWFGKYSYWDVGNRNGWYLGPLGGQDNHSADWGTRNDFRTAVLAESLTREAIVYAYRNRRFYSTEDKDLFLDLRFAGYPMGSRLANIPPGSRSFKITARDGNGDTFREVRLYRNGKLLETRAVSGNPVDVVMFDYDPRTPAYYYVIVRQNDDNDGNGRNDEAISSPIWLY